MTVAAAAVYVEQIISACDGFRSAAPQYEQPENPGNKQARATKEMNVVLKVEWNMGLQL